MNFDVGQSTEIKQQQNPTNGFTSSFGYLYKQALRVQELAVAIHGNISGPLGQEAKIAAGKNASPSVIDSVQIVTGILYSVTDELEQTLSSLNS